uniref:Uncharacterized protein n=1 Tax=Anguilla anguilla TaxID=7936 RepID=A0A0E9U0N0_ANGAN
MFSSSRKNYIITTWIFCIGFPVCFSFFVCFFFILKLQVIYHLNIVTQMDSMFILIFMVKPVLL